MTTVEVNFIASDAEDSTGGAQPGKTEPMDRNPNSDEGPVETEAWRADDESESDRANRQ